MSDYDALCLVANCTVPWKSLDAYTKKSRAAISDSDYVLDGKELMMKCFNCEKAECDNCHDYRYSGKQKIRMKEAREIFVKYYYAGYGKAQICEVMHISATTYNRYLKRFIIARKG